MFSGIPSVVFGMAALSQLSLDPARQLLNAGSQIVPRGPVEHLGGRGHVADRMANIAEAVFAADKRRGRAVVSRYDRGKLAHWRRRADADVQRSPRRAGMIQRREDGVSDVVDQDEVAQHLAILIEGDGLAAAGNLAEQRNDARIGVGESLAGTVD